MNEKVHSVNTVPGNVIGNIVIGIYVPYTGEVHFVVVVIMIVLLTWM